MATTILVSDTTKQVLERLKETKKAASYDQIIEWLVTKQVHIAPSMFGSVKGLTWKKRDRLDFHEL